MDKSRNQDQKNPEQSSSITVVAAPTPILAPAVGGNRIAPLSHPGSFINASSGGEEQLSFNLTEDEMLMNQ